MHLKLRTFYLEVLLAESKQTPLPQDQPDLTLGNPLAARPVKAETFRPPLEEGPGAGEEAKLEEGEVTPEVEPDLAYLTQAHLPGPLRLQALVISV